MTIHFTRMFRAISLFLACVAAQNIRPDIHNHNNWALLDRGEDCGFSDSERIIGGEHVNLGEYPWIVRLGYRKIRNYTGRISFRCGGSIISERYVLTAAHCTHIADRELILVRVGEYDVHTDPDCNTGGCAPPVQDIYVEEIISHLDNVPICKAESVCDRPDQQHRNDITLLRLVQPIEFNDYVYPVCLPVYETQYHTDYIGETVTVAGWGYMDKSKKYSSPILKKVSLQAVSLDWCNGPYYPVVVTDTQLCAGGAEGEGACMGDSGGPVVSAYSLGGSGRYFLLGIVSFGSLECAAENKPDVYTKVAEYMDWILDLVRP